MTSNLIASSPGSTLYHWPLRILIIIQDATLALHLHLHLHLHSNQTQSNLIPGSPGFDPPPARVKTFWLWEHQISQPEHS
ncbi:hypothetical protein HZ326_2214 [Fusarium oxysporum f. sp. albedinis]|nr:hypothetical protein HZ326_2214 [Fusarium oxysporum f. sp. albedinis]